MKTSTIIIGGGVTGLSIGWHLVRSGIPCLIIEKGKIGGEASSAAAGMITPAGEVRFGEKKLLEFFIDSLNSYITFIKELEEVSKIATDFHQTGSLMVAIDQDDEAELLRLYDYQKELNLPVTLLSPAQITQKEPRLTSKCQAGIEAPHEFFLDNLLLIEALKKAFIKSGGKILEDEEVIGLKIIQNKIAAVQTRNNEIKAEKVVMASGLGSKIEGLPENFSLPIRPVKGQALEVQMNHVGAGFPRPGEETSPLRHAIRTIHRYPVYLVPRSDGRIIIGATNEEMGMDGRVTVGAIQDLLYGASRILPSIDDMELTRTWVGHRPTTPDHAPILGEGPVDGLYLAMGMYRHGILLAPLVGKLMAELIAEGKHSEYFDVFGWKRFHTSSLRAQAKQSPAVTRGIATSP